MVIIHSHAITGNEKEDDKMPWNMQDYPDSMKNMEPLVRKKAIDIANAMEEEGYEEDQLIPIAQSQAKKWFENASEDEKEAFEREENPRKTDRHDSSSNEELIENNVVVYFEEDTWKVKTEDAKRADSTFDRKDDAVNRATEIAKKRETKVIVYKQDGTIQDEKKPN